jgi:hypothetical protein
VLHCMQLLVWHLLNSRRAATPSLAFVRICVAVRSLHDANAEDSTICVQCSTMCCSLALRPPLSEAYSSQG